MTVFKDKLYQVFQGEIYVKSQYLLHEHTLRDHIGCLLTCFGWKKNATNDRLWNRDQHQTVLCLSDDFLAAGDPTKPPQNRFPSDTNVITDNHIDFQPRYRVWKIPTSYFGIYSYQPKLQQWAPTNDIGLCINRMDQLRTQIFLEFARYSGNLTLFMRDNLINFNAWDPLGANDTPYDLAHNWYKYCRTDDSNLKDQIAEQLPLRSHTMTVEQVHVASWLNCVIETYAGSTHAFSEKTFRALVTPAPWTLFAAKNSVAYLRKLGFDVLDDVVDHEYDTSEIPRYASFQEYQRKKISNFVQASHDNLDLIKKQNFAHVRQRCMQAAQRNQRLLASMRTKWPHDLVKWLPQLVEHLS